MENKKQFEDHRTNNFIEAFRKAAIKYNTKKNK